MTTRDHQIIHYCADCELEYAGGHCAPCLLCALNIASWEAQEGLCAAELYRVIEHTNEGYFEDALNAMTLQGWTVEAIRIGHSENRDAGEPLYIAVFRRCDYDRERHAKAAAAKAAADAAYRNRRRELEDEAKAFIAARAEGA